MLSNFVLLLTGRPYPPKGTAKLAGAWLRAYARGGEGGRGEGGGVRKCLLPHQSFGGVAGREVVGKGGVEGVSEGSD